MCSCCPPLRTCCSPTTHRSAEDAAHARDGFDFYGTTLRVELARGGNPRGPPRGPTNRRQGGTPFRVIVRGLPASASWQDLKVWLCIGGCASAESVLCMLCCVSLCQMSHY